MRNLKLKEAKLNKDLTIPNENEHGIKIANMAKAKLLPPNAAIQKEIEIATKTKDFQKQLIENAAKKESIAAAQQLNLKVKAELDASLKGFYTQG
jgi:hypothetical protein